MTVHPRPRGEHGSRRGFSALHRGSSPPARGTLKVLDHRAPGLRFIPARAGNTRSSLSVSSSSSVHPRPRGEHVQHGPHRPVGASSSRGRRGCSPGASRPGTPATGSGRRTAAVASCSTATGTAWAARAACDAVPPLQTTNTTSAVATGVWALNQMSIGVVFRLLAADRRCHRRCRPGQPDDHRTRGRC